MKTEHVLSLTEAWRYSQNILFTFSKYLRVLRVELYTIKSCFIVWNGFENLFTSHGTFLSIYPLCSEKNPSSDLNYFFKENAHIITYNKRFSILVLLNMKEQYFYFMLPVLWEFYQRLRCVFHFNLPAPCAI